MLARRHLIWIGLSVIVLAAAAVVYLSPASTALRSTAANATPVTRSSLPPWNGPCPPTELKLAGLYNECASVGIGMSCPSGTYDRPREVRLHGTKHDFILYVEVNGGYHGPGTYALVPWPNGTLGKPDGVAKVAVREWTTGRLWQSSTGSLTIGQSEEAGWLYAGLGASSNSPVDVELNIAGFWSCYQPELPAPRAGGSTCPPASGEDTLLKELTISRIDVTAASASTASAFFPKAESVCLMDVGSNSFEVAFFIDSAAASAVHVCEGRSGDRYIYRVDGRTFDSARRLYWSVWLNTLMWTDSASLDSSVRPALGAARPKC